MRKRKLGADYLFEKGLELYEHGQIDEACEQFGRCLNLNRMHGEAWRYSGHCLAKTNRFQDARNCYDRSLDARPDEPGTWFAKAALEIKLGWQKEAAESLQFFLAFSGDGETYRKQVPKARHALDKITGKGVNAFPQQALDLVLEGYLQAVRGKNFQQALASFEQAIMITSDIAKAWQFQAMCLQGLNRVGEALDSYSRAIDIDPRNAVYWFNKGLLLLKSGQADDAVTCYRKAIEISPDYLEALSNLGNTFNIMGRHEEALECLQKAIKTAPDSENPWFNKALAEDVMGKASEAVFSYQKFLELTSSSNAKQIEHARQRLNALAENYQHSGVQAGAAPSPFPPQTPSAPPPKQPDPAALENAKNWLSQGIKMLNENLPHEAIVCFDKSIEFYDGLYHSHYNKGLALSDLNRLEEALTCFQKAAELESKDKYVWLNLGACLTRLGRLEASLAAHDRAVEIDPGIAVAWYNRGIVLKDLGQTERAIESYDRALKIDPKDTNSLNNKGTSLLDLGNYYDALHCFELITAIDPKHAFAWNNQGDTLNKLKRYALAIPCFEKALGIKSFAAPWCGKGESLQHLGKYAEAIEAFAKAIGIYYAYADAWCGKAFCEEKLGREQDMIQSLRNYVIHAPNSRGFSGTKEDIENARKRLLGLGVPAEDLQEKQVPAAVPEEKTENPTPAGTGEFIGQKYEVIRILGKGGFGVVYQVYSHETREICALKTFRDEYMLDEQTREMFNKEARVLIDMDSHPYLVEDYLVLEIAGRLYILMEYVPPDDRGLNTLEGYLERTPPDLAQALRWAIEFCHGMEFVISQGIRCHRDIKPANIMITPQKTIKISDFGLAGIMTSVLPSDMKEISAVTSSVENIMTMKGVSAGTPTHMPPEQFVDAASCDERSDIYAFGVVLFQMASGNRYPFMPVLPRNNSPAEHNRFQMEIREMHNTAPVPRLDSPLFPVIERCLEKEPGRRFQSFSELRAELEKMLMNHNGETVIPPEPADINAAELINKGLSLKNLGQFAEAMACYDEAVKLQPSSRNLSEAWTNRGACLDAQGQYEEAIKCYDKAISLNQRNENAWCNKGFTSHKMGNFEEALKCYDKALEIMPEHAIVWSNKAMTFNKMRQFDKAIICANTAIQYDKGSDAAWINKGAVYYSLKQFPEAIESYRKASEINPRLANTPYNIGLIYRDMEKYTEAIAFFDRAIALKSHEDYWSQKGNCLLCLNKFEEALQCLDNAIEINRQAPIPWYYKAFVMLNVKDYNRAVKYFQEFIRRTTPGTFDAWTKTANNWISKIKMMK